jgi:uncharacterized membrane protein YbhN (UPF0104 family)
MQRGGFVSILKAGLFVLVLAFVGRELMQHLVSGELVEVHLDWMYVVAGVLVALLSLAAFALIYREAHSLLQRDAPWLPSTLVAWISPLGKYLPGKVGAALGAIWIYRRFGIRATVGATVLLLATGSALSAGFVFLLPYWLGVGDPGESFSAVALPAWAVMFVGLLFSYPPLFFAPFNWLLGRLGRPQLDLIAPFLGYLRLVALGVGQLFLSGLAFWLVVNGVTDVALRDWYHLAAAYTVAGIVGLFAIFAPGGLGVREGMLLLLLESSINGAELALAVILMRIGVIIAELLLALCGLVLWKQCQRVERLC